MLGKQCGVSEARMVRFAMALGYEGYPEMQEKLRSMVRQRLTAEQRVGLMEETDRREVVSTVLKNDLQNLRKTMDELRPQDFDMAVECILSARGCISWPAVFRAAGHVSVPLSASDL